MMDDLIFEFKAQEAYVYYLEGCLVFAGYGAIVFMWQISLKRKFISKVIKIYQ